MPSQRIGVEPGTGAPMATITTQDSARTFTMTVKIDPATQEVVLRSSATVTYGDRFLDSGYGIIVNGLAPGTYDLAVFAFSTVLNNFTAAKVVRITVR
jgi:hypothetical protein